MIMKNKEQTMKKYPVFLENKPCGQDLLGGSHSTIAENIANVIANDEARIIGIDGGWGSGKSNLVDLIQDKLDKNKFHFFIYDAWGHQEDMQRRSILEELTKKLTTRRKNHKAVLDNWKWEKKLKELLSRKREVETKTIPKLSCGIILAALAIITTPILDIVSEKIESTFWKILIISIPLCLILLLLIVLLIKNVFKYCKRKSLLWCVRLSMTEAFNVYTDRQKEDTTFETISEEEPSSRKFRDWMHEIDDDLKNNILVIVFDNMDRLPSHRVQDLWASIHTFFADEKYKNIKVIVPFDREHIITSFKNEDNSASRKCFGNDFINKTFDAVYRVSPPIMSDWKKYFSDCWMDSFGIDVDGKVTQIYDLLSETITPREIIAFINEFVSIKQTTDKSIPDEYIALFIKGKDIISSHPKEEILNPTYLGSMNFMYQNDPALPQYISALYYQLPPEDALDIIYTENLKRALDNNDIQQIKTIQSKPNVFYSLLENVITSITNIPNTVNALSQCMVDGKTEQIQLVWDCVYKREKEQEITNPLQEYQKILIQHISNKNEYLKKLITGFYKLHDVDVINYYDSIQQLSEIGGINPFEYLIEKEADAEPFIGFVEQAKETYKQYKIICEQEKLNEYLSGLNVDQLGTLRAIPFIKNEYDLTAYSAHLASLVDANVSKKENIRIIYERLKELERPIEKKLPDAQIHSFFSNTKETDEFYYDLICMRISRLNHLHPNYQNVFNTVMNKIEDDFVENIAERIEYYINYGNILLNVENINHPLFHAVAKKLIEKNYGASIIDIVAILQKYNSIKTILAVEPRLLLNRLDGLCGGVFSNITLENINTFSLSLFEDAKEFNNGLTAHCIEIAKQYLNSKTKEEWRQTINEGKQDYQLLMTLRSDSQACFDAFKELLVENTQINNNSFTKDKCQSLINLFEDNGRKMLIAFNDIRDRFCGGICTMTKDLFDYYGEWLLQYSKLEEKTSSLRTIFPSVVLDKKENVQLILNNKEKMIRVVETAGEENEDFKAKIKSLLEGDYKDSDDLKNFAKRIGVKISIIDDITEKLKTNS